MTSSSLTVGETLLTIGPYSNSIMTLFQPNPTNEQIRIAFSMTTTLSIDVSAVQGCDNALCSLQRFMIINFELFDNT